MKRFVHPYSFWIIVMYLCWLAPSAATAGDAGPDRPAGLAPDQRPTGAPAITEFARTDAWRKAALRGVTAPVPESLLKFLDHQGAWYNPFTLPGMPGPYDLRGLHAPRNGAP